MKTLRYLLIVIGVLSVVSVTAATYGKMYQPQRQVSQPTRTYAAMPTVSMSSTGSMMYSGSGLPMAAVSGTTTANEYAAARIGSRPRRIVGDEEEGTGYEEGDETQESNEPGTPVGDAVLPLMLMAFGYLVWKRRRREENAG